MEAAAAATRVVDVDPAPGAEWDSFVREHPRATAYHLAAWAEILAEAYRFQPRYLRQRDPSGRITGVMPLVLGRGLLSGSRLNSLPVVRWAGPLAEEPSGLEALLEHARDMVDVGEAQRLHLVSADGELAERGPWLSVGETRPTWLVSLPADLDTYESTFKQRSKSMPRQIRKAEREGVIVRRANSAADLRAFYSLYLRTMRRRRAVPRTLRQLSISQRLLEPQGVFNLLVAEIDGRIIAGALFHFFARTADLLYNASDDRFLYARPNHALHWEAIRQAIDGGITSLDLGAAAPWTSLAEFKRRWGAEPVQRWAYDYPPRSSKGGRTTELANRVRLSRSDIVRRAWEHTPLVVTRVAGAIAYRYL